MRRTLRWLAAIFFVFAGAMHFARHDLYVRIMPPYVPWPLAMVYISGAAEIAGGAGLLVRALRPAARWGLVALLIAVLPANIYMATNNVQVTSTPLPAVLLWVRLPIQALIIWWVLWCSAPDNRNAAESRGLRP